MNNLSDQANIAKNDWKDFNQDAKDEFRDVTRDAAREARELAGETHTFAGDLLSGITHAFANVKDTITGAFEQPMTENRYDINDFAIDAKDDLGYHHVDPLTSKLAHDMADSIKGEYNFAKEVVKEVGHDIKNDFQHGSHDAAEFLRREKEFVKNNGTVPMTTELRPEGHPIRDTIDKIGHAMHEDYSYATNTTSAPLTSELRTDGHVIRDTVDKIGKGMNDDYSLTNNTTTVPLTTGLKPEGHPVRDTVDQIGHAMREDYSYATNTVPASTGLRSEGAVKDTINKIGQGMNDDYSYAAPSTATIVKEDIKDLSNEMRAALVNNTDKLASKASDLKYDAKDLAQDMKNDFRDTTHDLKNSAKNEASILKNDAKDFGQTAKNEVRDVAHGTDRWADRAENYARAFGQEAKDFGAVAKKEIKEDFSEIKNRSQDAFHTAEEKTAGLLDTLGNMVSNMFVAGKDNFVGVKEADPVLEQKFVSTIDTDLLPEEARLVDYSYDPEVQNFARSDLLGDAKRTASDLNQKTKDLAQEMKNDIRDASHDLKNKVKDEANSLKHDANDFGQDAKNKFRDVAHDTKNSAKDLGQDAKDAAVNLTPGSNPRREIFD